MTNPGPPAAVSFSAALRWWLRLGFISFGGPAGQIAIMHEELVEKRRWISERRYLHALNYCMVLPGPEAQQLATYIGWLMHGVKGGIAAGVLFVLPSLLILIALSWAYLALGDQPVIAGALYGIKPAVTAIVLHAAWRIGRRALSSAPLSALAAAAFVAIAVLKAPFPLIIVAAGLIGFAGGKLAPAAFAGRAVQAAASARGPALIGDTDVLPHTRFSWRDFSVIALAGFGLWAATLDALVVTLGPDHLLPQLGWFFTGAALVTFGGAYAVLPYVVQAAVLDYGWLSTSQMMDGLALGESTPGPLIMIVAFVGFVAGWHQPLFGAEASFAAAALAAGVATFFTFLPSFLFILLGAPLVEATHGDLKFTAPLTAITAAVVGVILNLVLFFADHVLWPQGHAGAFDAAAAVITTGAAIALFRFDTGIVRTLAACAVVGLILTLIPR